MTALPATTVNGHAPAPAALEADIAAQWSRRSAELADWAWPQVNRVDAFGRHTPVDARGQINAKTGKAIGKNYTVTPDQNRGELNRGIIRSHFAATAAEDVIGLHAIGQDDLSGWVLIDVDAHGSDEDDQNIGERNWRYVLHILERLESLGISALVTDSNGKGGFHVRVMFSDRIPALLAHRFGDWLISDWSDFGFKAPPESFPKSHTQKNSGRNMGGNWARLPGRHHTRDIWAKVWSGHEWVEGGAAADAILATGANDPSLIPQAAHDHRTPTEIKDEENRQRAEQCRREYLSRPQPPTSGTVNPHDIAVWMCDQQPGWVAPKGAGSGRDHACFSLFCWILREAGLSVDGAVVVVESHWNHKAHKHDGTAMPYLTSELERKAQDAMNAVNSTGGVTLAKVHKAEEWEASRKRQNGTPPETRQPGDESDDAPEPPPNRPKLTIRTAGALVRDFPHMRPVIIDGLLRRCEIMNIIAASKFGKSWLILSLALCVASGLKWLDRFFTIRGRVLLIDNELHPETLASRITRVAMAMGLAPDQYQDRFCVVTLRGGLMDLNQLSFELLRLEPGAFDLILVDAWYRLQPSGTDENSNGDVTALYNLLEIVIDKLGCAFGCVHHSSKGSQSGKAVTDVGSGAGAQSRAPDTHMIMRPHEVPDAVVVDAAVRSFQPIEPFVLRWEFPVFSIDDSLDPNELKREKPRKAPAPQDGTITQDIKQEREQAARERVLAAYDLFPGGETTRVLREHAGLSGAKFSPINADLMRDGIVEPCAVTKGKQRFDGYKRTGWDKVGHGGTVPANPTPSHRGQGGGGTTPPPLGGVSCPTPPCQEPPEAPPLSDFPADMVDGDYR